MNKDYYVYCHQRKDNGKCFYIGKGKGKRAYLKVGRNIVWNRIVQKAGGFNVVILVNGITEEKAFELEKDFIRQIGRENLCNMTDGGEGMSGNVVSEETKKKIKSSLLGRNTSWNGPRSEEVKQKISNTLKGKRKGVIFTQEHKNKLSKSKKGKPSPNLGKPMSEEQKKKISETKKKRLAIRKASLL